MSFQDQAGDGTSGLGNVLPAKQQPSLQSITESIESATQLTLETLGTLDALYGKLFEPDKELAPEGVVTEVPPNLGVVPNIDRRSRNLVDLTRQLRDSASRLTNL